MNPQFHDEFVALCALFYSGEISEEEWALLQIHMGYCDECHNRFLEYQQITANVVPAMAAVAASELHNAPEDSPRVVATAEQRLMSRLNAASSPVPEKARPNKFSWRLPALILSACGLAGVFLLGVHFLRSNPPSAKQALPYSPGIPAPSQIRTATPDPTVQQALERSQAEVAGLQRQLAAAETRSQQNSLALADMEKQLDAEHSARQQLIEEKDQLHQQLVAAEKETDSLRNKWASAGTDTSSQSLRLASLETKVRELNAAVEEKEVELSEKDRMLSLDKDFLAHDRDIRDLIGARNLYIADIFDTTENGKTAKQFGRIFYTKDRSLVFYGFDLDTQAGHRQDVSYQVWGSGSDRSAPVSLGLFYQDDSHKRWVLRCNDAKSLARLDMVFVTVEPAGGSAKPTGKPLLRAYLQIQPNHL